MKLMRFHKAYFQFNLRNLKANGNTLFVDINNKCFCIGRLCIFDESLMLVKCHGGKALNTWRIQVKRRSASSEHKRLNLHGDP